MDSKAATWLSLGTLLIVFFVFDGESSIIQSVGITKATQISVQEPRAAGAASPEDSYFNDDSFEIEDEHPEANAPRIE